MAMVKKKTKNKNREDLDSLTVLDKPVTFWFDYERFREKKKLSTCLTIILKTRGCYWFWKKGCIMCGYSNDSDRRITQENIARQIKYIQDILEREEEVRKPEIIKIFTSGSFLDPEELSKETRELIYSFVEDTGASKLIVESRPEFITKTANELSKRSFYSEIGIGLETTNDYIRNQIINKGFTFEQFKKAAMCLKDSGIAVKSYLLLKPPFLSEKEAIADAIHSSSILGEMELAHVISLNLMNVQSKTYVERLWERKLYRPPWLWSAIEVIRAVKELGMEIISDPVAAGKARGPHNCGLCDDRLAEAIKEFSLTQKLELLESERIYCDCIYQWRDYTLSENFSRIPIDKIRL